MQVFLAYFFFPKRSMHILGFQKMTLLDYPGKVACTVFTGGCNFRCPFCHNSPLVTNIDLTGEYETEDVLSYIFKRKGILDGVAVTGGEPLLNPDIEDFLRKIKDAGFLVKLDTNGSFPDRLISLVNNRLVDYVAIDVKNSKEKYAETVGLPSFDISPVEKSIDFLLSNPVDYEFRTTIVSEFHTEADVASIAKWLHGAKRYFLQNFEDSGAIISQGLHAVAKETLLSMQEIAKKEIPATSVRGI